MNFPRRNIAVQTALRGDLRPCSDGQMPRGADLPAQDGEILQ